MQHIEVRGGGINVAVSGDPAGLPVAFANSLGTDLRVWDELVARLPAGLRVVRMDKRGHGLSSMTPPSATIAAHAEDMAGVLDRLGVRGAVVVGLSIGGLIAQELAVARPELVSGLLLLDTAHRIGTAESWNARIEAIRKGGMEAVADAVWQRWFSEDFHRRNAGVAAAWRTMLQRSPAEGYIAACEALREADLTAVSPRIGVPASFATGTADLSTPPDLVKTAAALVPGARFQLIDGAAHISPVEAPDAVLRLLTDLLKETGHGSR